MKKILFLPLFLFLASCILFSCNDNDCSLSSTSLAHFDFFSSATDKAISFTDGVNVTGYIIADVTRKDTLSDGTVKETIVKDSLINDTVFNSATTSMSLPLSYTSQTTYVMHYSDVMRDTIQVNYKSIPYLESVECGTVMTYKINDIKYTTNVLDTIVITNPNVNNEETRNFIIYYPAE